MRALGEALVIQGLFGPLAVLGWFALDVAFGLALTVLARLLGRD